MANFSHLRSMELTPETAKEYILHRVTVDGKTPVLLIRPAGASNKPYFNAMIKLSTKNAKALQAGVINAAMVDENRDFDRKLFPRHVIVGWRDMLDAEGTELEYAPDICKDFVEALPDHEFDKIRNFAEAADNFVDSVDIRTKAKNSPSG